MFEESEGKRDPEDRGEETEENGVEDRTHLFLGRLTPSRPYLNHGCDRPGHTFNAEPQGGPGPDGSDGPPLPPEKRNGRYGEDKRPWRVGLFPHHECATGDNDPAQERMYLRSPPRHDGQTVSMKERGMRALVCGPARRKSMWSQGE